MLPRIKTLFHIVKSTKNWISVLIMHYGKKNNCHVIFRNGYKLTIDKKLWQTYIYHAYFFSLLPSAKLSDGKVDFTFKSQKLSFIFGKYGFDTILEIFATNPYRKFLKKINPKGKVVVDIGAAFGDTAIYFILNGAKKVYAFEPFPGYFELAKKNIIENRFSDQCEIFLSAVGGVSGSMIIDPNLGNMFGANLKSPNTGESIPIVTLGQIVDKFDINDGFLKIDTEGYEYETIENASIETLRKFSLMLIEYHYGFEKIESVLKSAGFSVSHTSPTHVYMPQCEGDKKNMYTGHVLAIIKKR